MWLVIGRIRVEWGKKGLEKMWILRAVNFFLSFTENGLGWEVRMWLSVGQLERKIGTFMIQTLMWTKDKSKEEARSLVYRQIGSGWYVMSTKKASCESKNKPIDLGISEQVYQKNKRQLMVIDWVSWDISGNKKNR